MLTRSMLQGIGGWPAGPPTGRSSPHRGGRGGRRPDLPHARSGVPAQARRTRREPHVAGGRRLFPRPSCRTADRPGPAVLRGHRVSRVDGNDWSALVPPAGAKWKPTQRVSVCIPARNPLNLRRVLYALALQTYPSALMEVSSLTMAPDQPITAADGYPFPVSVVRLERTLAFGASPRAMRPHEERMATCWCSLMPTSCQSDRSLHRTRGGSSIIPMSL